MVEGSERGDRSGTRLEEAASRLGKPLGAKIETLRRFWAMGDIICFGLEG